VEIARLIGRGHQDIQATQLDIGDASGQAFRGLPQQLQGCRAEHQKLSVLAAGTAVLVDQATQDSEQVRGALDLVQDDKLVGMQGQKRKRISQLDQVLRAFQVQIKGGTALGQNVRQGRLADLPGPQ